MVGSYALLTHSPLETPLPVRLACVKHAASIHPDLGSKSHDTHLGVGLLLICFQ
jgi:hypothetical protein